MVESVHILFQFCARRLTQDFVFQKYPSLLFKDMLKLDLPNCGLKHVDLSPVSSFHNLSRYVLSEVSQS